MNTIYVFLFSFFKKLLGKKNKWYIIEGNIGCGKTTLIRNLKKLDNVEVIEEPVSEWVKIKDENDENILGLFYKETKKYAYLFQTIVFKSRIMSLDKLQEKPYRFSERSIWTDKFVFAKNCYEMGLMNTIEKRTYDNWAEWLENKMYSKPDGIIYLRAEPEVCNSRMKKRDRKEESGVSLDYLKKIHDKHEEWLNNGFCDYTGIPIYVIDNSYSPADAFDKIKIIVGL